MSKKELRGQQKITGKFSLLIATITGLGQKIFLIAMRIARKEKVGEAAEVGELTESKWVFGCSTGSASDIATGYDQPIVESTDNVQE